jgi:protein with PEP-CTERM/exosortase system signal
MLLFAAAVCVALFTFGQNANATRISLPPTATPLGMHVTALSSADLLGTVVPGLLGNNGQAARDALMTNNLRAMGLGTHSGPNPGTTAHPLYSRSLNAFSPLPAATTTNAVITSGLSGGTGNVTIDLSHYGTYQYLVAAYDGPNGGVAVWDIASLTGTITIFGFAHPEKVGALETGNLLGADSGQFRITSWTLLNQISPPSVPDGGATVMLLGAALGALGVVRRYLKS